MSAALHVHAPTQSTVHFMEARSGPIMMRADSTIAMQFQAIDIAKEYFLRRGYTDLEINALVGRYVHQLMATGEQRPLVLANRAIAMVEQEIACNQEGTADGNSALRRPRF